MGTPSAHIGQGQVPDWLVWIFISVMDVGSMFWLVAQECSLKKKKGHQTQYHENLDFLNKESASCLIKYNLDLGSLI